MQYLQKRISIYYNSRNTLKQFIMEQEKANALYVKSHSVLEKIWEDTFIPFMKEIKILNVTSAVNHLRSWEPWKGISIGMKVRKNTNVNHVQKNLFKQQCWRGTSMLFMKAIKIVRDGIVIHVTKIFVPNIL